MEIAIVVLSVALVAVLLSGAAWIADKNAEIAQLNRDVTGLAGEVIDLIEERDRLKADLKAATTSEVLATLQGRMGGGSWPTR